MIRHHIKALIHRNRAPSQAPMVAIAPFDFEPEFQQHIFATLEQNGVQPPDWLHITLFQFPNTFSIREIDKTIADIATNTSPFQLEIDGVSTFDNKEVTYLRVKKSRQLSHLRRRIISAVTRNRLEARVLDWLWTPHITIVYRNPAFKAVSTELAAAEINQTLTIKALTLRKRPDTEKVYQLDL